MKASQKYVLAGSAAAVAREGLRGDPYQPAAASLLFRTDSFCIHSHMSLWLHRCCSKQSAWLGRPIEWRGRLYPKICTSRSEPSSNNHHTAEVQSTSWLADMYSANTWVCQHGSGKTDVHSHGYLSIDMWEPIDTFYCADRWCRSCRSHSAWRSSLHRNWSHKSPPLTLLRIPTPPHLKKILRKIPKQLALQVRR